MTTYDEIVSLGVGCRAAFNIRRTFGIRHAFPFDWWVTPLPGLAAFLKEPSAAVLYDPALLHATIHEGKPHAVRNRRFDIELTHEFPRDPDQSLATGWADQAGPARSRTEHLLARFLSLPSTAGRVLFIRQFMHREDKPMAGQVQHRVGEVLDGLKATLPGLEFDLLLVDPIEEVDLPGVSTLWINDPVKDWRGSPDLWTAKLLGAGIQWSGFNGALKRDPKPERDQRAYT